MPSTVPGDHLADHWSTHLIAWTLTAITWTPKADDDRRRLALDIEQARKSWDECGVPIGAVLAHNGEVLAAGLNQRVQKDSAIPRGETASRCSSVRSQHSRSARVTSPPSC